MNIVNWENLSQNLPSHIGYTQKFCKCIRENFFYHMSDYCISDTIDGRTPRNCKTWRKPFRSHTVLYNVAITQERNPKDKMNVRKLLSGAAITSYPKVHMKEKLCQYLGHPEMFLHQQDTPESTHRGWLQIVTDTEAFSRSDVSVNVRSLKLGENLYRYIRYMKVFLTKVQKEPVLRESHTRSHVTEIWLQVIF